MEKGDMAAITKENAELKKQLQELMPIVNKCLQNFFIDGSEGSVCTKADDVTRDHNITLLVFPLKVTATITENGTQNQGDKIRKTKSETIKIPLFKLKRDPSKDMQLQYKDLTVTASKLLLRCFKIDGFEPNPEIVIDIDVKVEKTLMDNYSPIKLYFLEEGQKGIAINPMLYLENSEIKESFKKWTLTLEQPKIYFKKTEYYSKFNFSRITTDDQSSLFKDF